MADGVGNLGRGCDGMGGLWTGCLVNETKCGETLKRLIFLSSFFSSPGIDAAAAAAPVSVDVVAILMLVS